jgi:hypothetical protein
VMLKKIFKNIYSASFLASFISCITVTQVFGAKHALHINELISKGTISNSWVNILTTVITIGVALVLILYSQKRGVHPEELIKSILKMYILFTAIMVVVIYEGSLLTIENNFTTFLRLATYFVYESLMFILPLIVWGIINNIYSNDKKKITYVVLSLVISLIAILTPLIFTTYFATLLFSTELKPVIISFVGLCILLFYITKWLQLSPKSHDGEKKHIKSNKFPWVKSSLLLLVVTTGGVFTLFNSVFIYYIYSQHPHLLQAGGFNDSNYLVIILTSSTIIAMVLFAFAEYSLRKKSWRFALQGAVLSLLASCVLAYSLVFFITDWYFFSTVTVHNFFGSVRAILIFPIIQMLYLYIPVNDRFNMKLKVEMICVPAAILIISNAVNLSATVMDSRNAVTYSSLSLALILMIAAVWASRRISMELKP